METETTNERDGDKGKERPRWKQRQRDTKTVSAGGRQMEAHCLTIAPSKCALIHK